MKVAMPNTMAGIVGLSSDEKLSDFEIEAKHFILFVVVLLVVAKLFHIIVA